jgi:hypothetical protein
LLSRIVAGGLTLLLVLIVAYERAGAEWYVAGYGGYSSSSSLGSATMPELGRTTALNDPLLSGSQDPTVASLTQTFKTSDLQTESSPIFGGKVGYFFDEQKFPWLGIELEIFTTKPDIKAQVVQTNQDILYTPVNIVTPCVFYPNGVPTCPQHIRKEDSLQVPSSSLRVFTAAANVLVRYPGRWIEPYVGVGVGAFYFRGTGAITGDQVVPGLNALGGLKFFPTTEWGLFVEGKYNRATITSLDSTFGVSGTYDVFHVVGGVLYRF